MIVSMKSIEKRSGSEFHIRGVPHCPEYALISICMKVDSKIVLVLLGIEFHE